MSVPKPSTFEPLASSDPVAGDPYEVAQLGKRLTDTAAEIGTQTANLRRLAEHSTEFWSSKAASKFHKSALDLAGRIEKAQHRYDVAGQAMTSWSSQVETAQDDVYQAVHDYQAAEQATRDNVAAPAAPAGSPAPTPAETAEVRRRSANRDQAATDMKAARRRFEDAVSLYNSQGRSAAHAIEEAYSHDGLKDSWWDRNFHWVKLAIKIIGIAILVLAIAAIIVACPWSLGALAFMAATEAGLATAATVISYATAALIAASLGLDLSATLTGKQGWTPVVMDLVAAATFGYGKVAEKALAALGKYGTGVAKGVAGARAGRQAMADAGLPRVAYSAAKASSTLRDLLSLSPKVGGALGDADAAALKASEAVAAGLKGVKGTNLVAAAVQNAGIAKDLAELSKLSGDMPAVVRISLSRAIAAAVTGTDGIAQSTTLVGTGGYTVTGIVRDWIEERELKASLDDIVRQYSNPRVTVR